jgi:hypothetical protein
MSCLLFDWPVLGFEMKAWWPLSALLPALLRAAWFLHNIGCGMSVELATVF